MGKDPAKDLLLSGKATPITQLPNATFLVKPLFYVKEFEAQGFAQEAGFVAACCGCPACKYPSRRDITEETFLLAFRGPLWEFDVPGVRELIHARGGETLARALAMSAPGLETKKNHLPHEFFQFAVNRYLDRIDKSALSDLYSEFDPTTCLDDIGCVAPPRCQDAPNRCPNPVAIPSCD
jgi:hypothetical protein